jgi:predicted AAA+ superfamily ATPase
MWENPGMRYVAPAALEVLAEGKMAFVAGPRQVGKTTLARSLLPDPGVNYFTWDLDRDRRRILRTDGQFWAGPPGGARARLVLDEIHKYPRWKRLLKGLYDTQRDAVEIVVTGSGRLDVYQRGGDSLLGRYALHRLHPFTVGELVAGGRQDVITPEDLATELAGMAPVRGAREALAQIERFTGFPEPLFAARIERLRRWRRMRRDLVLREDLRDLTRIREIGLIDHLVELLPDRIGRPLSVNALREDLGVAFDTAKTWLETLARLYFLFELRPFAGKLARTLRREAKVYLFDPSAIEDPGARFENLVALHLRKLVDAWNDRGQGDFGLWYVRDKERREVDFLVTERRRPFLLLETKLSDDQPSPALRYFHERLRPAHAVQLIRHGEPRKAHGIIVVPAERLLARM